jgi:hypothetical protein
MSAEPASAGNCIPPATPSRVGTGVFLQIIKPPLTGARPSEEAPAYEAVQHNPVHDSLGGGSFFDDQLVHFSMITPL